MSWSAHQFEAYILQKHLGEKVRISYLAIVAGDMLPDFLIKIWVYGFTIGDKHYGADHPADFHRTWPGAGFTHSLAFGVLIASVVWFCGRKKAWGVPWGIGVVVGQWAHVLTDINDSRGTMLLFPFTTHNFSIGTWAYGAQVGKHEDAAAYFTSLGVVMDSAFLLAVFVFARGVLSRSYFNRVVRTADPAVWERLARRLPEDALLAIYRGLFVFAFARLISWSVWAQTGDHPYDLSWGGPYWLTKVAPSEQSWGWAVLGVVGVTLALAALWFGVLRRHRLTPADRRAGGCGQA